jgi:hypothetical protein
VNAQAGDLGDFTLHFDARCCGSKDETGRVNELFQREPFSEINQPPPDIVTERRL